MPVASPAFPHEPSLEALLDRLATYLPSFVPLTVQHDPAASCDRPGFEVVWSGKAPGLEAAVRLAEAGESLVLLVEFRQSSAPWRSVTIRVQTEAPPEERSDPLFQKAVRRSDWWRFRPKAVLPLEGLRNRLHKRGDRAAAEAIQAEIDRLPPEVRDRLESRQTVWWRTLLLDPRQKVEDVSFLLTLILLQEDMVPTSPELELKAVQYIRQHAGRCISDGGAYLVLNDLRRNFTEPKNWRGVFRYIWRTAKGKADDRSGISETDGGPRPRLQRTTAAHDVSLSGEALPDPSQARLVRQQRRHRRPRIGNPDPVSVAAAAARLPISRDTLYDWINSGKIPGRRHNGRSVLDAAGLDHVEELLRARKLRMEIRDHLRLQGKTAAAAKKFLYRRCKAGVSLEEVLGDVTRRRATRPRKGDANESAHLLHSGSAGRPDPDGPCPSSVG